MQTFFSVGDLTFVVPYVSKEMKRRPRSASKYTSFAKTSLMHFPFYFQDIKQLFSI